MLGIVEVIPQWKGVGTRPLPGCLNRFLKSIYQLKESENPASQSSVMRLRCHDFPPLETVLD